MHPPVPSAATAYVADAHARARYRATWARMHVVQARRAQRRALRAVQRLDVVMADVVRRNERVKRQRPAQPG